MPDGSRVQELAIGSVLVGPVRSYNINRRRWYSGGLRTAALGPLTKGGEGGIHDDQGYAKAQGLPGAIADGMTLTNWCSTMLVAYFGLAYVSGGALRTKYIKPTFMDDTIAVYGRVLAIEPGPDGKRGFKLDIWCENQHGVKVTDGDATVTV